MIDEAVRCCRVVFVVFVFVARTNDHVSHIVTINVSLLGQISVPGLSILWQIFEQYFPNQTSNATLAWTAFCILVI